MNKKEEIEKLKHALVKKIKLEECSRYIDLHPDEIMKIVADSGLNGKYSLWICREYLKNNIQRFEDIESRCKQALILFKNNLSKFTEQQKQLNKISFNELETLVSPYHDILTQNAVKRMNKEKIWAEIDVIYEGVEGKIYIPKTKKASVFLGQGTKWCTASTEYKNMFDRYNNQGPLYIFVLPEKDKNGRESKYQFHFETKQFMNSEDQPVTPEVFSFLFEQLINSVSLHKIIDILLQNPKLIDKFRHDNQTNSKIYSELTLILINMKKLKTYDINMQSFEKSNIENVFFEFIKISGSEIVSVKNPTEEMCLEAVKQNGYSLFYITNQTEKICIESVKNDPSSIKFALNQTYELCELAVKLDPDVISYINNQKFISDYKNKNTLQNKEENFYLKNPHSIQYTKNLSEELCSKIIDKNPNLIQFMPNASDELKIQALRKDGHIINKILNPTEEMKIEAVKQNANVVHYINNPSKEIITEAVKNHGELLMFIKGLSYETKLAAIKHNGKSIKFVNNPSEEMKLEACKNSDCNIIKEIINPTETMKMIIFNNYLNNKTKENIFIVLKYIKPQQIKNLEYIIQKTEDNVLLNQYFISYLNEYKKQLIRNEIHDITPSQNIIF